MWEWGWQVRLCGLLRSASILENRQMRVWEREQGGEQRGGWQGKSEEEWSPCREAPWPMSWRRGHEGKERGDCDQGHACQPGREGGGPDQEERRARRWYIPCEMSCPPLGCRAFFLDLQNYMEITLKFKIQFKSPIFFKYWVYPSLSKIVNSSLDIQHTQTKFESIPYMGTWFSSSAKISYTEIPLKCKIQFFLKILRIPFPNKNCE